MDLPNLIEPKLHPAYSMGTRIQLLDSENMGTITGVAYCNVITIYIITLDQSFDSDWGPMSTVALPGSGTFKVVDN